MPDEFADEGMVGEHWGTQASGILFLCQKKYLLLLRSAFVLDPGLWGIPGGAIPVKSDGTPMGALPSARKEVAEEIGQLPNYNLRNVYKFQEEDFTYTTYVAEVPRIFSPKLNWEHSTYGWFEDGDFPAPLHPGVRDLLKRMGCMLS